jgi:hypothetical protein
MKTNQLTNAKKELLRDIREAVEELKPILKAN